MTDILRTVRMRKFRAIFPQRVHDEVMARLHEAGVVQLKEISELEVTRRAIGEEIYELSSLLGRLREAHEFLGPPRKPLEVRELTYAQILKRAKRLLEELEPKLNKLKEKAEELDRRKRELLSQMEVLENFREVEIPLSYLQPTDEIRIAVGRIAGGRVREFCDAANETFEQKVFVSVLGRGRLRILIVACRAREEQKLSPLLYKHEVEVLEIPPIPKPAREAVEEIEKQLAEIDDWQTDLMKKRKKLAEAWAREVSARLELLEIQAERLRCIGLFGYTDTAVAIEGWVPKKVKLDRLLSAATNGRCIIRVYEPQKVEIEKVPVRLENPKGMGDYELLTETYGLPKYDEVDPTPFLALTFPLFFALCLSDAGYGALLGIFMVSGFWISKAFPKRLKMIIVAGSALAVVVGLLMGGVFGFSGELFGVHFPLWVDPLEHPVPILKLVVIIGIIQIILGLGGAAALKDLFRKDFRNLILNHLPRVLIVMGFFGLSFSILGVSLQDFGIDFTFPKMELFGAFNPLVPAPILITVFRILLYVGLGVGMVGAALMGKGLMEKVSGPVNVAYGITGFVADAASYSRLMALGIATGIIAYAINYILGWFYGSLSPSLSAVSTVLLVPLLIALAFGFFVGHCFNIFIQSLGAFIHTMRLHYVEFFGKFYESGGEKFAPFKAKRVFTKLRS